MANDIELQEGQGLDENIRPIKIRGEASSLEIAKNGKGARITGDLEVTGTAIGNFEDAAKLPLAGGNMTGDITASGTFTIESTADIHLDANGLDIQFLSSDTLWMAFQKIGTSATQLTMYEAGGTSADDYFQILTYDKGLTIIKTNDNAGNDAELSIDVDGDLTLNSATGKFIMEQAGTQFSVANSAYAGTILGYRCIGESSIHATYTLTTSFAVPAPAMTVRFIAPPSGAVEVMVQILSDPAAGRFVYFGLSDNATYNSLGNTYEVLVDQVDESDQHTIQNYWTITGLTAGDTYNYWLGAKANAGTNYLRWGGTASTRYSDFIMKVTALPEATSDFAVYD